MHSHDPDASQSRSFLASEVWDRIPSFPRSACANVLVDPSEYFSKNNNCNSFSELPSLGSQSKNQSGCIRAPREVITHPQMTRPEIPGFFCLVPIPVVGWLVRGKGKGCVAEHMHRGPAILAHRE